MERQEEMSRNHSLQFSTVRAVISASPKTCGTWMPWREKAAVRATQLISSKARARRDLNHIWCLSEQGHLSTLCQKLKHKKELTALPSLFFSFTFTLFISVFSLLGLPFAIKITLCKILPYCVLHPEVPWDER